MGLLATFNSPKTIEETSNMIINTIDSLNGKINKIDGNVIKAEWRSKRFIKVLAPKFTFYIGRDMVRVVMGSGNVTSDDSKPIVKEYKAAGYLAVWDDFVIRLCDLYPSEDFCLKPGTAKIETIKFLTDGIERVYSTSTWYRDSIPLFDGGISKAVTVSETRITNKLLAQVRYTNGLCYDGIINKNSPVYHEILSNMSVYEKK